MEKRVYDKKQLQKVVALLHNSKGGNTRKNILTILSNGPENCNQLSNKLGISWWAPKKHLSLLLRYGLIEEVYIEKTIFYELTELGVIALRRLHLNYFPIDT